MRERAPGVWELIVEGGVDPVTGRHRQVSRVFRGNLRDAKRPGQNLGFSAVQVAIRAGHDPSVAAKHYTGSVAEADRALAKAVAALLVEPPTEAG